MNASSSGDAVIGLAELGRFSAVLLIIVAIIIAGALLVRRFRPAGLHPSAKIKVVGSAAVGVKERVVIVEVNSTWLVLGVGVGRITRLDKLPAPPEASAPPSDPSGPRFEPGDSFAKRFAKTLKHNAGLR
jgi:flagellar protein FliO/FliZ